MDKLRILDDFIRELHKASEKSFVDVKHVLREVIRNQDSNENTEQLVAMVDQVDNDIDQLIKLLFEMRRILKINRSQLVHGSEQQSDVQTHPTPGLRDSGYVDSTIIAQPEEDLENPTQGSRNLIAQPQDAVEYKEMESEA